MSQREEYAEYLRSPEWKARRLIALEHAEHRCQVCNTDQRLQVHHRTYERVRNELPRDLTVLCDSCHRRFHGIGKPRKVNQPARSTKGALTIPCPTCGSKVGKPCRTPEGKIVKAHRVRRAKGTSSKFPVQGEHAADMRAMKERNAARAALDDGWDAAVA